MSNALMLIILFVIVVGAVGALITYLVGEYQTTKEQARLATATLVEVQQQAPELKTVISLTAQTIIGNKEKVWFENLLWKTFDDRVPTEEDVRFLTRQYTRLLFLVKEHMEKNWEAEWNQNYDPAQPKLLVKRRSEADPLTRLDKSLEWLRTLATQQSALIRERNLPFPAWDKDILEVTDHGFRQVHAVAFNAAGYEDSITTRANPRALEAEIVRLHQAGASETTAPPASSVRAAS